jgi:hypothetical protein
VVTADADRGAQAALEIGAERAEGAGRELLIELLIQVRAEPAGDAGREPQPQRLVRVPVGEIVDRRDEVVRVEARGPRGKTAPENLLLRQR